MSRLPLGINFNLFSHHVMCRLCLLFRVFFSCPTNCPNFVLGLAITLLPSSSIFCSRTCLTMHHSTSTEGWVFAELSCTEHGSH